MGALNSSLSTIKILNENPWMIPTALMLALLIIIIGVLKINKTIEKQIKALGAELKADIKEKFEFMAGDITKIKSCNEDIMIMRPVMKDIYDHRDLFEKLFKKQNKLKDDIKINATKLQPDIDYTGR